MTVRDVDGCPDTYLIDVHHLGAPEYAGVYLLDSPRLTLIDSGTSNGVERILAGLSELGRSPEDVELIIPTHVHLDHAGGAGYLVENCPRATVLCHPRGLPYLSDPEKVDRLVTSAHRALGDLAEGYGDMNPIPPDRIQPLSEGDEVDLGDRILRPVEAPGHAPHQNVLFEPDSRTLFTGDEAGMWLRETSHPATPPPNFHYKRTLESLDSLADLQPERLAFAHFGLREDGVDGLAEYREVLTRWVDEVRTLKDRLEDDDEVLRAALAGDSLHYELWEEEVARQSIETDVRGVLHYLNQTETT